MKYTPKLQEWMQRANVTSFRQLSLKAGVSLWSVQQLRRGNVAQMRLETLSKLAAALQVSPPDLWVAFAGEEEVKATQGARVAPPLSSEEWETHSLQLLESWLLQWYTAVAAVEKNPDLPASRLVPLVRPVEELIQSWGVEAIAPVGAEVPYDPQWHEVMSGVVAPGDPVRVRYIGYRHRGKLLHRARVSPL
ncbi:helix-turn-helix domain-containing protein [Spirulina subsalsa FACHB-351]|uniref:Helix-turn-helix domain-containing protein n=1 Tax=Spirulina subsalsa FACHB-351 TaxID=234711 RepID=A0ABT3L657_9CYAN|nr:helix-turn-helix domain-containing protein [Spirulina subsalsa]MCW6036991.1 helix-turn-helix domain-containing protein [Spirulina subsalsa FACHB-351]